MQKTFVENLSKNQQNFKNLVDKLIKLAEKVLFQFTISKQNELKISLHIHDIDRWNGKQLEAPLGLNVQLIFSSLNYGVFYW